jgi:hypothetical protein
MLSLPFKLAKTSNGLSRFSSTHSERLVLMLTNTCLGDKGINNNNSSSISAVNQQWQE